MTDPDKGPPPSPAAPAKPWWRWLLWPFVILGVLATIVLLWLMVLLLDIGPGRNEQPVMAKTGAERRFVVGQIAPLDGTSLMAIEIAAADSNGAISSKGYMALTCATCCCSIGAPAVRAGYCLTTPGKSVGCAICRMVAGRRS
ncbi:MAG: hypothetical protein ACK4F2_12040 [Novosphingobium meiothermophilum]